MSARSAHGSRAEDGSRLQACRRHADDIMLGVPSQNLLAYERHHRPRDLPAPSTARSGACSSALGSPWGAGAARHGRGQLRDHGHVDGHVVAALHAHAAQVVGDLAHLPPRAARPSGARARQAAPTRAEQTCWLTGSARPGAWPSTRPARLRKPPPDVLNAMKQARSRRAKVLQIKQSSALVRHLPQASAAHAGQSDASPTPGASPAHTAQPKRPRSPPHNLAFRVLRHQLAWASSWL